MTYYMSDRACGVYNVGCQVATFRRSRICCDQTVILRRVTLPDGSIARYQQTANGNKVLETYDKRGYIDTA